MKVYVVTSGEYSDYGLDGVFSSRELAQKHIDTLTFDGAICEFNEILELELDPNKAELTSGRVPFQVDMRKDGSIFNINKNDFATGLYLCRAYTKNKIIVLKLIVL